MKNILLFGLGFMLIAFYACGETTKNDLYSELFKKYPVDEQTSIKCEPRVFSKGQVSISLPEKHPKKFAIQNPVGEWIYLVDDENENSLYTEQSFLTERKVLLQIDKIKGIVWMNGNAVLTNVFTVEGEYLLFLADNLETEPENTFSIETKVYYFKR
jgi:hypothetical protein